jgi:hypothetical protein
MIEGKKDLEAAVFCQSQKFAILLSCPPLLNYGAAIVRLETIFQLSRDALVVEQPHLNSLTTSAFACSGRKCLLRDLLKGSRQGTGSESVHLQDNRAAPGKGRGCRRTQEYRLARRGRDKSPYSKEPSSISHPQFTLRSRAIRPESMSSTQFAHDAAHKLLGIPK